MAISLTLLASDFFFAISFLLGSFSVASGATEPGVPGAIDPCRVVAPSAVPPARARRLLCRASSSSCSPVAAVLRTVTRSFVILGFGFGVVGRFALECDPEYVSKFKIVFEEINTFPWV